MPRLRPPQKRVFKQSPFALCVFPNKPITTNIIGQNKYLLKCETSCVLHKLKLYPSKVVFPDAIANTITCSR
uniref:Uncharacterized protein n=1 Tax=Panagrellus redivivus TaxID=6233 RepID=A0A7E4VMS0_PANRE